jgi:hypothetical protein
LRDEVRDVGGKLKLTPSGLIGQVWCRGIVA